MDEEKRKRERERTSGSFIANNIDFVKMCDNNSSSDIKKKTRIKLTKVHVVFWNISGIVAMNAKYEINEKSRERKKNGNKLKMYICHLIHRPNINRTGSACNISCSPEINKIWWSFILLLFFGHCRLNLLRNCEPIWSLNGYRLLSSTENCSLTAIECIECAAHGTQWPAFIPLNRFESCRFFFFISLLFSLILLLLRQSPEISTFIVHVHCAVQARRRWAHTTACDRSE